MCRSMLAGLMGGNRRQQEQEQPKAPATPGQMYGGGTQANVVGTEVDTAGRDTADPTGQVRVGGGVDDRRRKRSGVPGLGL